MKKTISILLFIMVASTAKAAVFDACACIVVKRSDYVGFGDVYLPATSSYFLKGYSFVKNSNGRVDQKQQTITSNYIEEASPETLKALCKKVKGEFVENGVCPQNKSLVSRPTQE